MRETVLSNCERNFILKAASELKRLDGRKLEGFRDLKVVFGSDWGLCYVTLGETRVLTQVTCEIQEPKTTKPNEGLLFINVELSAMASSNFEPGRPSNLSIHINRLLEKCIKDSRAVDLESLCIVAEDKVWALKVDVNILNHDGSLVDCASISAVAALAHFKIPDVTRDGEEIKVHSIADKDPIPVMMHHYPICVSFALLNNSENIFADPTAMEERVSDAHLTFGINAFNEICCLHLGGTALISPKLILTCSKRAASRSKKVVEIINNTLKNDLLARQDHKTVGFVHTFEWNSVLALSKGRLQIQLNNFVLESNESESAVENIQKEEEYFEISNLGKNCAELNMKLKREIIVENQNKEEEFLPSSNETHTNAEERLIENIGYAYGEGGASKWKMDMNVSCISGSHENISKLESDIKNISVQPKKVEILDLCDDSEEEEVIILNTVEPSEVRNTQHISPLKKKTCFNNFNVQEESALQDSKSAKPKRKKKSFK